MTYIIDDAALVAGLGEGTEPQRRELSRLIHDGLGGGPQLHVPALCLAAAVLVRSEINEHVAMLVTETPSMAIRGLAGQQLAALVAEHPGLGYPAAHAASEAMRDGLIILTTDTARYARTQVHAVAL